MTFSPPATVPHLSPAPRRRRSEDLGSLSIYLSIHPLERMVCDLLPFYGGDCPVAVVCEQNEVFQGTLSSIAGWLQAEARQPVRLLVG